MVAHTPARIAGSADTANAAHSASVCTAPLKLICSGRVPWARAACARPLAHFPVFAPPRYEPRFLLTPPRPSLILNYMVKYSGSLDATFGALADPTRRAILSTLMLGQASISELARPHRMSLPAVLKHVRVLERAGLVSQSKNGRTRFCQLAAEPLEQAEDWISRYRAFWEGTFDSLERYLAEQKAKEDQKWPRRNRSRESRSN